jgi:hypothetical protein
MREKAGQPEAVAAGQRLTAHQALSAHDPELSPQGNHFE